jgi:hypothetical protein
LQLHQRFEEISQHQSALELKRREAAHAKVFIAAQHAQQETLDALALRFESDCLKAEDNLEKLEDFETNVSNEYKQWNLTENERKDVIDRAVEEGKRQSREIAELQRQLENSSLGAAAARQGFNSQKSNSITANVQVENIRKALSAAQEEAAVLRRRLDETEVALAERTTALKKEARSASVADEELLKALKQLEIAKEGLDAEVTTGKELSLAAASAERRRVEVEQTAKAVQNSLHGAKQDQKLAEMDLQQRILASKQSEAAAKAALIQTSHSAQSLADALQKHRELEEAIETQDNVEKSVKEHHSAFLTHVEEVKQHNTTLNQKITELSKQKIRLQQERECLKEKCLDRESALSNTQAQGKAVECKTEKLHEQLQNKEGALYRVQFQLLMAKRAAAVGERDSGATGDHHQRPESLRLQKLELQSDLENSKIAHRKQVRSVWEVEAAAQHVGAAAEDLQQEITKLSEQQKIQDVALKTAESSLQASISAKEDAQMAVDRASMTLSRSQQRLKDKAKAVMELSTAVEEGETSFKARASELENKLQELAIDHHAAVNALQASKGVLKSRNVAVATATATLATLQLKTTTGHAGSTDAKERKKTMSSPAAVTGGGVAVVCAEMQRQVEELQAALAAAEADCDVLEHALTAQKQATATANNHSF